MTMTVQHYGIDDLRNSMVRILGPDGKAVGSGFIIRADGYLITCHHVIYQLEQLKVEYQGQRYEAEWREGYSNPEVDIAILKIPVADVKPVPIINPRDLSTSVIVYGFPRSKEQNFPDGYDVSAAHIRRSAPIATISTYRSREIPERLSNPWNTLPLDTSTFLSHRIDEKVDPGTSGGPVFAEALSGVVGVVQCSKSDESYVIRWDNIWESLDRLGLEPEKNVVRQFLEDIENQFKRLKLFHTKQAIILKDQYVPIQITLERKYRHEVESSWGYAETEEELKRAYALKGMGDESRPRQVPWEEAKKEAKRIIVLADPGMGKSTLLQMEALSTAQGEWEKLSDRKQAIDNIIFPLYLKLHVLQESGKEVLEAIPDLVRREYPKTAGQIIHLLPEKLSSGKCLLLLDALDEVPKGHRNDEKRPRQNLQEKLERFARNYPCPIICTSRIVGYSGAFLPDAKEVEIVPFSSKQTERYIRTWFTNAADSIKDSSISADGLLQELRNKPQIRGLAQNPLLLSLLCSLYQDDKLTLPTRRCQIYQEAVRSIFKWRNPGRKHQDEADVDLKIERLEGLAHHLTCEGKEIFSIRELRNHFEKGIAELEAARFVTELTEDDGIIQKLERDGERYLFLHRTFQEYLTASYLNQAIQTSKSEGIALARAHFWDYDWHETLSLLAGLMKDPLPLLKAITDEKDDIFRTMLLLAGRCLAECEDGVQRRRADIADGIFEVWHRYPSADFVRSAMEALSQVNGTLLNRLLSIIRDGDSFINRATEVLVRIRDERAVEPLLQLLGDERDSVRAKAAGILGRIGDRRAVEPLLQRLRDKARDVRFAAAGALGWIGDERAVEPLLQLLRDEKGSDRSGWLKRAAEASRGIEDEWMLRLYREDLPNITVRFAAAGALGQIGDERAVEPLLQLLRDERQSVRSAAVSALEKIGDERAVEPLLQLLRDEKPFERQRAAEALGEIGDERAVEPLLQLLRDKDGFVRNATAWALRRFGDQRAVEPLLQLLRDENSHIRKTAAGALGRIGDERAVEPLFQLLGDNDNLVRLTAAEALWAITQTLCEIATGEILKKLIQVPELDIFDPDIFHLARRLAVRFSKDKVPFIPVYPELVAHKLSGNKS
jgi:HEAT repeat protein